MQLGILTYYSLNVDYIEAKFCVNKDQPDMCCKGKCYISKQLEGNQQDIPSTKLVEERDIPFFVLPKNDSYFFSTAIQMANEYQILNIVSDGFKHQAFQPPDLI